MGGSVWPLKGHLGSKHKRKSIQDVSGGMFSKGEAKTCQFHMSAGLFIATELILLSLEFAASPSAQQQICDVPTYSDIPQKLLKYISGSGKCDKTGLCGHGINYRKYAT